MTPPQPSESTRKYRTIVADPPWDHSDGTGVDLRNGGRVTHLSYPTLSVNAIKALPVSHLAAVEAHLYLWTTSRYLPNSFAVARAWGFHYTATLVWCKPSRGWSTGGMFQNNVEFVLFCRNREGSLRITSALANAANQAGVTRKQVDDFMGTSDMAGWWLSTIPHRARIPTLGQWQKLKGLIPLGNELDEEVAATDEARKRSAQGCSTRWFQWFRGGHSAKPEAFLDLVEQVSPGPYLELFARRQRLGWDTWGAEALEHVELSA